MQGVWRDAHSLLKVSGALWGCGYLYKQWGNVSETFSQLCNCYSAHHGRTYLYSCTVIQLSSQNWLTIQLLNSLHWKLSNFNHAPPKVQIMVPDSMAAFNFHRITEWDGKTPPGIILAKPLLRAGSSKAGCSGPYRVRFWILQEWRHSLSGEFFQWLTTLTISYD